MWPDPNDEADGRGAVQRPRAVPVSSEAPPWMRFRGRWGGARAGWFPPEQSSPRGPAFQGIRWDDPSAFARAARPCTARRCVTVGACDGTETAVTAAGAGALALLGFATMLGVLLDVDIFGRTWELHTMVLGSLLTIVGVQVIALGLCAHAYGIYFMQERERWFEAARDRFGLEHGLLLGGAITFVGLAVAATIVIRWLDRGLGALGEEQLAVFAATLIVVGIQIFFSSFLLSILGLRRRR
jgi:hypothetical protein